MSKYGAALFVGAVLVVVLTAARVIELLQGIQPSAALTAAFASAVAGVLAVIAVGGRNGY